MLYFKHNLIPNQGAALRVETTATTVPGTGVKFSCSGAVRTFYPGCTIKTETASGVQSVLVEGKSLSGDLLGRAMVQLKQLVGVTFRGFKIIGLELSETETGSVQIDELLVPGSKLVHVQFEQKDFSEMLTEELRLLIKSKDAHNLALALYGKKDFKRHISRFEIILDASIDDSVKALLNEKQSYPRINRLLRKCMEGVSARLYVNAKGSPQLMLRFPVVKKYAGSVKSVKPDCLMCEFDGSKNMWISKPFLSKTMVMLIDSEQFHSRQSVLDARSEVAVCTELERLGVLSSHIVYPDLPATACVFSCSRLGERGASLKVAFAEEDAGMALIDFYTQRDKCPLSSSQIVTMVRSLFSCLETLHVAGKIHGDIKPENIVVVNSETMQLRLIDAGLGVLNKRYTKDDPSEDLLVVLTVVNEAICKLSFIEGVEVGDLESYKLNQLKDRCEKFQFLCRQSKVTQEDINVFFLDINEIAGLSEEAFLDILCEQKELEGLKGNLKTVLRSVESLKGLSVVDSLGDLFSSMEDSLDLVLRGLRKLSRKIEIHNGSLEELQGDFKCLVDLLQKSFCISKMSIFLLYKNM